MTRFELVTSSLPRKRSTPELHRRKVFDVSPNNETSAFAEIFRARDRVRTGDIQLGRLTLYQLSYSRIILQLFYQLKVSIKNVGRAGFEPAKT